MRYSVAFFLILLCNKAMAQRKGSISICSIKYWHSNPVPADSVSLVRCGKDTTNWSLFMENGSIYAFNTYHPENREYFPADTISREVYEHLMVDEGVYFRQSRGFISVSDGYLIGINSGEWGAKLVWYSKDGRKKHLVSNDHIIEFVRKDGRIYAIEGIDHLGISKGSLIEVVKTRSGWVSLKAASLPAAPFGIVVNEDNNFIIGTSDNIIEMFNDGQYRTIYVNPFWNRDFYYLYPESLVMKEGVLYVGMRKGIFKYNMLTGDQKWLTRGN